MVVVAVLGCVIALVLAACAPAPQTAPVARDCPPLIQLVAQQPLACYVDANQYLQIGNPSGYILKGTPISYAARLPNGGTDCATLPAREDIPPHLFSILTYQRKFDQAAPCQAWKERELVFY